MRRTRSLAMTSATMLLAGGALAVLPATAALAAPDPVTVTFAYTGGPQTWTVPAGVTSIDVVLAGAAGGGSSRPASTFPEALVDERPARSR